MRKDVINRGSSFDMSLSEIKDFEKKACLGDSSAAFSLYSYYNFTKNENSKSLYWLLISAENGHRIAMYNLAYDYAESNDMKKLYRAFYWANKAKKLGDKDADDLLVDIKNKIKVKF